MRLVIECADTSLSFDRGRKAQLYAAYGFHELWVVDANSRTTLVHTGPTAVGWAKVVGVPATGFLQPTASGLFTIAFSLAELD